MLTWTAIIFVYRFINYEQAFGLNVVGSLKAGLGTPADLDGYGRFWETR